MELFEQEVRAYVEEHKPFLSILTPCYGGLCYVNYMICIINTINVCKAFGIDVQLEFCKNDSLVTRARNNLVAKAMTNPKVTHMLFIDADISWSPVDVLKLIISHQLLIGGVYPLKHFNFDRLQQPDILKKWKEAKSTQAFCEGTSDVENIQHNLLKYNFNHGGSKQIINNLLEVRHLATGFMMFRRETIDCMQKAFPSTKYIDDVQFLTEAENANAFALFDCAVREEHYLSEDWLFSDRWLNMGGKIHVNVTINLTHTGIQDFNGSFLTSLL